MTESNKENKELIYIAANSIEEGFLQNSEFCLNLQNYVQHLLTISIVIIPQKSDEDEWDTKKSSDGCTIQFPNLSKNREELKQIIIDLIKNLFQSIQSKIFENNKVQQWFQYPSRISNHIKCLEKILNEKARQVFAVCETEKRNKLKIYFLSREPFNVCNSEEIETIISEKIFKEKIVFPFDYEQSNVFKDELDKLIDEKMKKGDVYITLSNIESSSRRKQQKYIILFGYYRTINRLKGDILNMMEKYRLLTWEFQSIKPFQSDFINRAYKWKLQEIAVKYVDMGVKFHLAENQFQAPEYLKDKIESRVKKLIVDCSTTTLTSTSLFKDIAEHVNNHLKIWIQKYPCGIHTELEYQSRSYILPKGDLTNIESSKLIEKQSEQFYRSMEISRGMIVKNGSIEIRTGDIALQKVDTIVISTTSNGLKESVIERAGRFTYEHTYTHESNIQFTITKGGVLNCKHFLFSNWIPLYTTDDNEQQLRQSIDIFFTKTMEYISKDQNPTSVAFTVNDSCKHEIVLAEEMIAIVKKLLESKNLQMKIIFLLLPEQESLRKHFCTLFDSIEDSYTQLEWTTAVLKITLISTDNEYLIKRQDKIQNYLKRCVSSLKIIHPSKLFSNWNQSMINAFYQYCRNQYVCPRVNKTQSKMELIGPMQNILQIEQIFNILSINNSIRREQLKINRIMISFCQEDQKLSKRLINRLLDERFSVWGEPIDINKQRDVTARIDKSDCIILCISESSSRSLSSEKEAKYAYQTNKLILPVKIRNDRLQDWQHQVFHGKILYQLFGSEYHFDLEFGRMLIEVLRQTKSSYITAFQRKFNDESLENDQPQYLLTVEQRRSNYDATIRRLTERGRINATEMKNLIKQLENVIDDITPETENENNKLIEQQRKWKERKHSWKHLSSTDELVYCVLRWLEKSSRITKQNLPPFSPTGDINDAPFPIPQDILDQRDQVFRTFLPSSMRIFVSGIVHAPSCTLIGPIPNDDEYTYGQRTDKVNNDENVFKNVVETDTTDDFIPRKRIGDSYWPTNRSLVFLDQRLIALSPRLRKRTRKSRISDQKLGRSDRRYRSLTTKQLDAYKKKFAQQMHKNAIEFEQFCAKYATVQ